MGKVKDKTNPSGSGSESKGKSRRWPEKNTNEYAEKREKNNAAVKKSREKARLEAAERAGKAEQLRIENGKLDQRVASLEQYLADLKDLMARSVQPAAPTEQLMAELLVLSVRAEADAASVAAPSAHSSSTS